MTVTLDWISNRTAWDALVCAAGRSNLLQSWAWGEAKRDIEGWQPRRAVLACGTVAIAAVQVLEKRVGPLRAARINRGPLWLHDDLTVEAKTAALRAIRRPWRFFRGGALLIAAEWPGSDAAVLKGLGFLSRAAPPWRSAWLDLSRDEGVLRKSLNGKWRNMLVNAEKAGLTTEVLSGPAGIDRLLPHYQALMAEKGFQGVSPPLARALAAHSDPDDVIVLWARSDGQDASAVLVVRHGMAATYLIGWNSEAGRRARANHLLLWQAIIALKDQGCRWLDVGGIDDTLTPGVAAFKRGLNGEEYVLAGEWLSL